MTDINEISDIRVLYDLADPEVIIPLRKAMKRKSFVTSTGERCKITYNLRRFLCYLGTKCNMCGVSATHLAVFSVSGAKMLSGQLIYKNNNDERVMTTDHILPLSKGGKTNTVNLQCLCNVCNAKKSNTIETNAEIKQVYNTRYIKNRVFTLIKKHNVIITKENVENIKKIFNNRYILPEHIISISALVSDISGVSIDKDELVRLISLETTLINKSSASIV